MSAKCIHTRIPDCEASTSDSAPHLKLGQCEVCARNLAKYTCPRCEVKTCSLPCNKIHKLEVECNGERDRAKFISLNKFTNLDLSSDYRLLEEVSRVVEATRKGSKFGRCSPNHRDLKLQQQALNRGVTLKFLPKTFVRHKNNTTLYNIEKKLIEWHVDWVFDNSDSFKVSENRVPENAKLSCVIDKYLNRPQPDELIDEKLQYYKAAGSPGIKILLKAEQKSGKKFYEVDSSFTLIETLKNRIVIEYPTYHVVLRDQGLFYDIIDSDDEEDSKKELRKAQKTGQEVINKIIQRSESDGSLYESLKNLLFISEYSEDELDLNDNKD